ncbi:DUF2514 family protein [Pseudomonas sp. BN417]|nr:DUF2514 family protein [Pseudomonas sp. BN417]
MGGRSVLQAHDFRGGSRLDVAELFESADRRAGELAAALDRGRVTGKACKRAYESVRSA